MKKSIFMIALFILSIIQVSAQNKDEVTLVVSADGATKEEATKVALRSAIEQAYGTFVSANTTILNDELVKDEIVTVSNGNIKNYEEIASSTLPNGNQMVTLKATVSISKLVSYAQSKGATTEFAGATFGMNMKMKELNKKNEMKVLENLLIQIKQQVPLIYDRKLIVNTPKIAQNNKYEVGMKLLFETNENFKNLRSILFSTLGSISLTDEEKEEYKKLGLKCVKVEIQMSGSDEDAYSEEGKFWCRLRNDENYICSFMRKMYNCFLLECRDYKIVDNNGKVYRVGGINTKYEEDPNEKDDKKFICGRHSFNASGIDFFMNKDYGHERLDSGDFYHWSQGFINIHGENYEEFTISISNEDLMKISSFNIERK